MTGKLFSEGLRSRMSPKLHAEPSFRFLDTSGWARSARIRDVLEEWYSKYPLEHALDLRNRFRSPDDKNHLGAFFELYLHELLTRIGYQVVIHPETPSTKGTRPDFAVRRDDELLFYLEAVVAGTSSPVGLDRVMDALNKIDDRRFLLVVDQERTSPRDLPHGKIRREVEQRLRHLTPDDVLPATSGPSARGYCLMAHKGSDGRVLFRIYVWPRGEAANDDGPLVGAQSYVAGIVEPEKWIRRPLLEKAKRYGDLGAPFIVAMDYCGGYCLDECLKEALFGDLTVVFWRRKDGSIAREWQLVGNGLFGTVQEPRYTRVSGVVFVEDLFPGAAARRIPSLIHHPWTTWPVDPALWPFTQVGIDEHSGRFERMEGRATGGDILGLELSWPDEGGE